MDDVDSGGDLVGENGQPTDGIFPSASETEGWIDKATDIHCESAVNGVHDGHFCESLHHEVTKHHVSLKVTTMRSKRHTLEYLKDS